MPLFPGELLNHRYRIVSLLAVGAYGVTYRAWDVKAQRQVAIKEYLDTAVDTQKRFRAEARRLGELTHPQLPTVLDHFALEDHGQYLITDYIDGVNLQELLTQYGRFPDGHLPTERVVEWLESACRPLAYLHEQKQLHLGLKPVNIRLTPTGEVFLVDTGLPGLGIRPHSSGYGSPEQQAQQAVSPASDIYSLGATLYTLLTGQVPPNALSLASDLADLKPARELNPNAEPYLSVVASRAMSLRPDARYESVTEFARGLVRPSLPSHTAPTPPTRPADFRSGPAPQSIGRPRRRLEKRTLAGLIGLVTFILLSILGFVYLNTRPEADITEAEATATFVSAIIAAATQLAPTPTPLPEPTLAPTPTPEPVISKTGSRMIFMPGGQFRMGRDAEEGVDVPGDEQPSHLLTLDAFFIDETEVTNGQYAACVQANICPAPDSRGATYHPAYYGDSRYENYPVIFVSWYDADTFCRWRDARLPTEAEWEKAAGFEPEQGIRWQYPWGDAFSGERLNYCDANCTQNDRDAAYDDGHQDTAPVGSYPDGRSPIGLYDMSGNVMEWVADWYDSRYYPEASEVNPLGPLEGQFKVIRGGSWLSPADEVTIMARTSFDPTVSRANLGFRCALTPP